MAHPSNHSGAAIDEHTPSLSSVVFPPVPRLSSSLCTFCSPCLIHVHTPYFTMSKLYRRRITNNITPLWVLFELGCYVQLEQLTHCLKPAARSTQSSPSTMMRLAKNLCCEIVSVPKPVSRGHHQFDSNPLESRSSWSHSATFVPV